jgi:hypothetical protein
LRDERENGLRGDWENDRGGDSETERLRD